MRHGRISIKNKKYMIKMMEQKLNIVRSATAKGILWPNKSTRSIDTLHLDSKGLISFVCDHLAVGVLYFSWSPDRAGRKCVQRYNNCYNASTRRTSSHPEGLTALRFKRLVCIFLPKTVSSCRNYVTSQGPVFLCQRELVFRKDV